MSTHHFTQGTSFIRRHFNGSLLLQMLVVEVTVGFIQTYSSLIDVRINHEQDGSQLCVLQL